MCDGCLFVTRNNNDIVTKEIIEKERTSDKKKCMRPWDPKWREHDDSGKVRRYHDFLALVDTVDEIVLEDATTPNSQTNSPVKKKVRRENNKAPSNNDEEEGLQTPPVLSRAIAIFDVDGNLTNEAVALFEEKLKAARKNGVPPNNNDKKVAGMFMNWMFDNNEDAADTGVKVATLKTFYGDRSITVAKVPGTYAVEETSRNQRTRLKKVSGWIDALKSGGFNTGDEMIELMLQKRKNPIPKKYIIKAWNSSFRMDTETTLAAIKFAAINLTQLERLSKFIDIETRDAGDISSRGLRLFAATKECYKLKKELVAAKYPSMKYKTVPLMIEETIKGKKGKKVLRSTDVSVGSIRPMQIIAENITVNRANGTFVPAAKRYNDDMYNGETALFKFSADGGAGSIKAVVNPVNVDNPQGQQHVHPFLEFRSKDSYDNCKKVLDTHPDVHREMEDVSIGES